MQAWSFFHTRYLDTLQMYTKCIISLNSFWNTQGMKCCSWVDWTAAVQHNAVVRALYMISTEEWREEDKAVCGVGGGGVLPPPPPYFLQHPTRKSHHHHHTQNLPQKPQCGVCTLFSHCHRRVFSHQNDRLFPGFRNEHWVKADSCFICQLLVSFKTNVRYLNWCR